MYGDDNLFESMVNDFEAVENDPKKNIEEKRFKVEYIAAGGKYVTTNVGAPSEGQVEAVLKDIEGENNVRKIVSIESVTDEAKVDEAEDVCGHCGYEGEMGEIEDTDDSGNVGVFPKCPKCGERASDIALYWKDKDDADEMCGKKHEAIVDEEEVKEGVTKQDLLDIANTRLGWAVAEQLKPILDDPTVDGIENAELNHNAVKMIYHFVKDRDDEWSKDATMAIIDWVEEGYGDPEILEAEESNKGNRMYGDKTEFENRINDFEAIEADEKKDEEIVEEEAPVDEDSEVDKEDGWPGHELNLDLPKHVLKELQDAWELIGSHDSDSEVRIMADEKAAIYYEAWEKAPEDARR